MRRFGIICLLIFILFLSTRIWGYLVVKIDSQWQNINSQLQNEERVNYTPIIDSKIVEEASAKNVSVDSYLSTELFITLIKFSLIFAIAIYIICLTHYQHP